MIKKYTQFIDEQDSELIEKAELKFAILLLQTGNLEKKMKGIAIIKEFTEK